MASHLHSAQTISSLPAHYQNHQPHTIHSAQRLLTPVTSSEATPVDYHQHEYPRQDHNNLPCLPLQARHLSAARSLSYRPAVLRPTERPLQHNPLTPPQSSSNSFDSIHSAENCRPLARRTTVGSAKQSMVVENAAETQWTGVPTDGKVTVEPTRDHWKPDWNAPRCDAAICNKPFTLFERRHHCRRCGNVFCKAHTPFSIPLDQDAHFHPDGIPSRACDYCWSDYKSWQAARSSSASIFGSHRELSSPGNVNPSPSMDIAGIDSRRDAPDGGSIAGSVPRDWTWSTF